MASRMECLCKMVLWGQRGMCMATGMFLGFKGVALYWNIWSEKGEVHLMGNWYFQEAAGEEQSIDNHYFAWSSRREFSLFLKPWALFSTTQTAVSETKMLKECDMHFWGTYSMKENVHKWCVCHYARGTLPLLLWVRGVLCTQRRAGGLFKRALLFFSRHATVMPKKSEAGWHARGEFAAHTFSLFQHLPLLLMVRLPPAGLWWGGGGCPKNLGVCALTMFWLKGPLHRIWAGK